MEWTSDFKPRVAQAKWNEDLLWQAERGAALGREHCSCQGRYHALWGALRASGFLGSLHSEEATISSAISQLLNDRTRLLIGGSADPATLCAIGRISKSSRMDVTIVDQCAAPLELINEFADQKNISCETIQADILEFDSTKKWDLIFLNYTLSFIAARDRAKFFRQLSHCLAPGGTLVCLAKTGVQPKTDLRDELESAWSSEALKALRNSKLDSYMESSELEQNVRHYAAARTIRRFNIVPAGEIERLLLDAGLTSCSIKTTPRKWVLKGITANKSDAESSVIVTARNEAEDKRAN